MLLALKFFDMTREFLGNMNTYVYVKKQKINTQFCTSIDTHFF